jgi:hypothetical protein
MMLLLMMILDGATLRRLLGLRRLVLTDHTGVHGRRRTGSRVARWRHLVTMYRRARFEMVHTRWRRLGLSRLGRLIAEHLIEGLRIVKLMMLGALGQR